MKRPRLVIADDHVLVIDGLRRILEPACEIVDVVEDGRKLLQLAEAAKPDIVLMDISMPSMNGLEAARHLKQTLPSAKVIFVTMHADATYVVGAFRAGAVGYVLKRCAATELLDAIQEVLRGRTYVTPLIRRDLMVGLPGTALWPGEMSGALTGRQREVLQLVAEGHPVKQIAGILKVSPKTVTFHKSNLMRRLGMHSTAELTKYAMDHGIVGT